MENWNNGKLEKWNNGKMEKWKNGKMEYPYGLPTVDGVMEAERMVRLS